MNHLFKEIHSMPLTTFARHTFREDLFDYLDEKFDEADENGWILADSVFLGQLSRASVRVEHPIHISQLIKMIHEYVAKQENMGETVGPVVRELHELVRFDFKNNLKFLIDSLDDDPVQKDDLVKLMIKYFRSEPFYNGYLIDNDNPSVDEVVDGTIAGTHLIPAVSALYHRLNKLIGEVAENVNRIQIIVRQQEHYTALDVDRQNRRCFVIDSAGDSSELNLREFIRYSPHIDSLYYVAQHEYSIPPELAITGRDDTNTSRIQKDECSCSIFSLEYSFVMAKKYDLYSTATECAQPDDNIPNAYSIRWDRLDPEFVRLSQSPTYKKYYSALHNYPHLDEVESNSHGADFYAVRDGFKRIALFQVDEYPDEIAPATSDRVFFPLVDANLPMNLDRK